MTVTQISELIGKTCTFCNGEMFKCSDGTEYKFYHSQDCCEYVRVYDIIGDLDDLVGSPLVLAEEVSNKDDPVTDFKPDESYTWTFYRFATVKGTVTVRWLGESNGYYSEDVSFRRIR